jgi:CheY-like chemotaxis protein
VAGRSFDILNFVEDEDGRGSDHRARSWLSCFPSATLDTRVAADGQEALERLTAFNADVIVADLVMPCLEGCELLLHL